MYRRKRIGPSTEPQRTPEVTQQDEHVCLQPKLLGIDYMQKKTTSLINYLLFHNSLVFG